MDTYFIADTHLGHANIIKYCKRPFSSAEEMNRTIFENWEKTVKKDDTVYHLGDVIYGRNYRDCDKYLKEIERLPGQKFLVPGNHDQKILRELKDVFTVREPLCTTYCEIGRERRQIVLCHYPLVTWQGVFYDVPHFHGHVHGLLKATTLTCDVGVDVWNFCPVNVKTIFSFLKKCPPFKIPDKEDDAEC